MFSYLRSAVTGHTTSVAPPHATAPVEGTLPASWYTDPYMYALDRRAIHSKYWTLISHTLRFPSAGTWVKYVVADFPIFVNKDRKGNIRAFHDLCRHRAYPVLPKKQTEGTSNNFPCLYHGLCLCCMRSLALEALTLSLRLGIYPRREASGRPSV